MLKPRIIPTLLIHNKGLYKSVKFTDYKYVGDPLNAVKIFNEKKADEIMVLDIDASVKNLAPNFKLIENLALECRMPLCYGGGIKTVDHAKEIFSLGVEKIAISSAAIENPSLIADISKIVGSQSVVVVIDVKKKFFGGLEIFINNAKKSTGIDPVNFIKKIQQLGAGEIVINSIDDDGMMHGYNFNLIEKLINHIRIPLTVLGGAGNLNDIGDAINKFGTIGISAGSLFVFKGKYKAVLINYPTRDEKDKLINYEK